MDAPWIAKKELAIGDKNEKLHKEILGFVEYIAPTTKEIKARERLVSDIKYIVDCLWPEQYKTVPFGSVESGLLFPSSDVDINIEPIESRIPVNVKSVLRAIHKRGMKDRLFYFQDTTLILHARIPILTIQRGAAVDVSIANDICSSDRTVVWIKQYPELKPLFMVLKQAISNCKLTSNPAFEPLSAKTNGLASYGLICLIVNYLEHEKPRNIQQKDYYATLLMGFLRFYGQFDETKTAISMQNGGHYYSFGESDLPVDFTGEPGKLVVVDPDKGILDDM
ncbi:hypothetical protein K501DRAFT_184372 [Backusella circina FSU 941]|nr:hypothetical protein K501DRAFT_184372 [Backusella circina FSU 941]